MEAIPQRDVEQVGQRPWALVGCASVRASTVPVLTLAEGSALGSQRTGIRDLG